MQVRSWVASLAAVGTLCLLSSVSFARPHDDPAHRSALHVTLTLANGTRHAATLQGVGCTEAMCSRVRAQDDQADSIWLDGLASVRQISGAASVRCMSCSVSGTAPSTPDPSARRTGFSI